VVLVQNASGGPADQMKMHYFSMQKKIQEMKGENEPR